MSSVDTQLEARVKLEGTFRLFFLPKSLSLRYLKKKIGSSITFCQERQTDRGTERVREKEEFIQRETESDAARDRKERKIKRGDKNDCRIPYWQV